MRKSDSYPGSVPPIPGPGGHEVSAQPLRAGGSDQTAGSSCAQLAEVQLRDTIARLQEELADRQADPRPMPSSVMRAYQALIDKHFAELARLRVS